MHQQPELQPRKLPRQARAVATVDAILQATLEILKRNDDGGATTTRVALRAGVSVGTLYQYFPHQNALRFAALQRHLDNLAAALEDLCTRHSRKRLAALAHDFSQDYATFKIFTAPDRWALQGHMADLGMEQEKAAVFARAGTALGDLVLSAPDGDHANARSTAVALVHDMHTVTCAALGQRRDPARMAGLHRDLAELVQRTLGAPAAFRPKCE